MKQLTSYEQFQSLLASQSDWIIFKHSDACSVSGDAYQHVDTMMRQLAYENIYMLDVLHTQDLKHKIAQDLEIKHESPQVIVIKDSQVVGYVNHRNITNKWLEEQIEELGLLQSGEAISS